MKINLARSVAFGAALAGLMLAVPVEAKHTVAHHHSRHHSTCLRFNKTTGAIAGAAGGAVLGKVLFGGPVAVIGGAAVGGIAGHKLAHNRRKHC